MYSSGCSPREPRARASLSASATGTSPSATISLRMSSRRRRRSCVGAVGDDAEEEEAASRAAGTDAAITLLYTRTCFVLDHRPFRQETDFASGTWKTSRRYATYEGS